MRTLVLALAVAAALAAAGTALAGGWATAGVAPPDDGIGPGDTWPAEINVLQHGRTPLEGVQPTLTITDDGSGATKTFAAEPTAKAGVYLARVVFPDAGKWSYVVDDGFGGRHTFAPVQIVGGDSGGSVAPLVGTIVGSVAGGLALVAIAVLAMRRRRPRLAPAGN